MYERFELLTGIFKVSRISHKMLDMCNWANKKVAFVIREKNE